MLPAILVFVIQLVKSAKFKAANPDTVWVYFTEVIAPYIVKWQGQSVEDQRSLGHTTSLQRQHLFLRYNI